MVVYSLWGYLELSQNIQNPVPLNENNAQHQESIRLGLLICLYVVSIVKAVVDLVFFYYSLTILYLLLKLAQPQPTKMQLCIRSLCFILICAFYLAGIVMREFIYTGISELENINDKFPLMVLDMIQSIICVFLAYIFSFMTLGILYHYGSFPRATTSTASSDDTTFQRYQPIKQKINKKKKKSKKYDECFVVNRSTL